MRPGLRRRLEEEALPGVRKLAAADPAVEPRLALLDLHRLERLGQAVDGGFLERLASVACVVADVQHEVADRAVVELPERAWELHPPRADRPGVLEGEVARVVEVELEEARVLASRARHDRLDAAAVGLEALVLRFGLRVARRRPRVDADAVGEQRELAAYFQIRSIPTLAGALAQQLRLPPPCATSG